MNKHYVSRILTTIGISLIVLGVSDRLWGIRGDERHYFTGLIVGIAFWEFSARLRRFSIALAVAILAVSLLVYPMLTDGPLRKQSAQIEAEKAAICAPAMPSTIEK